MALGGIKKLFASKKRLFVILGALIVISGVALSFGLFRQKAADSEYFFGTVERGSIRNVVNATGTVQAVVTVQVGSQVSGQIQALYADFNSVVKRGQLLAKIDPRNFEAQVENARATLLAAEARVRTVEAELNTQMANLQSARANLEAARVARDNMKLIFDRYTELYRSGVASQNDYDTAKANYDSAVARYNQAAAAVEQVQAQMNATRAQLEQAKAQVEQAKADLNRALVNLEYTNIYSPVDGVVISRNVDVGQTVAASLQAPTLFVIANDLTKMQVNANIDEADIGKISDRVDVRFTVDAYPGDTFTGKIVEVRLNPQTVQNVVTYSVIISVDNSQLKLKPGMTANITITVDQRENVLKVPNAALRYLPPGVTREKVFELMRQGQPGMAGDTGARPEGPRTSSAPPSPEKPPSARPAAARPASPPDVPAGLSAEAAALLRRLRDPNLSPEDRRALVQKMRELPEADRQKIRESFQWSRPGGSGPGQPGSWGSRSEAAAHRSASAATTAPSGPLLAPGQLWDPSEKLRFPTPRHQSVRPGIVWVLNAEKKPEPRRVMLGITDGVSTEIVSGEVKEGDKVIIGDTTQATPTTTQTGSRPPFGGPFGGFGPPRRPAGR
ncbi:MAG TPA: efflux RND transporter periplasmic adaptor subunit [Blastocatellia bacterium]|nr:efflux RND transporter periplasmic adaptor subunit [Blastocatellia bacterium]